MIAAWRRKIRASERRTRPVRTTVELSLGPQMKAKFFDAAEAMRLHPNQLATQIVESWLVDRKKPVRMPEEHYTATHAQEMVG